MSAQKSLDQLQRERGANDFTAQTKNVHVVVFNALMSGENIMDEGGAHARNLVRGDGCANAAAAESHTSLKLARCDGPSQGNDIIGVVILWVQLVCTKIHNIIPQGLQHGCYLRFKDESAMV
jgi:hypothetical protein